MTSQTFTTQNNFQGVKYYRNNKKKTGNILKNTIPYPKSTSFITFLSIPLSLFF